METETKEQAPVINQTAEVPTETQKEANDDQKVEENSAPQTPPLQTPPTDAVVGSPLGSGDEAAPRLKRKRSKNSRLDEYVDPFAVTVKGQKAKPDENKDHKEKDAAPFSKRRRKSTGDHNSKSDGEGKDNTAETKSSETSTSAEEPKKEDNGNANGLEAAPAPILEVYCRVCNKGDDEDKLLMCDGCDGGFHIFCLVPPLDTVPDVPFWFCEDCKKKLPATKPKIDSSIIKNLEESDEFKVDQKVLAYWKDDKQYYTAFIRGKGEEDYYFIRFEDGEVYKLKRKHIYSNDEEVALKDGMEPPKVKTPRERRERKTSHTRKRRSSVKTPIEKQPKSESEEKEPPKVLEPPVIETILCKTCGLGDNDEKLLLCDRCDVGYHIYCLQPPLDAVPDGQWFCSECERIKEERKKERVSAEHATKRREDKYLSSPKQGRESDSNSEQQEEKPIRKRQRRPSIKKIENAESEHLRKSPKKEKAAKEAKENGKSADETPKEKLEVKEVPEVEEPQPEPNILPAPPVKPKKPKTVHGNPLDTIKIEKRPVTETKANNFKLWKGGLTFEGQFICNMDGYCNRDHQSSFNKNEWPKILEGKKLTVIQVPTDYTPVYLLPEKSDSSYDRFVQSLEKNLWVCSVSFPKRNLLILPASLMKEKGLLGAKPSLVGYFVPKTGPESPQINPLQQLQQIQKMQLAKEGTSPTDPTKTPTSAIPAPPEMRFMNKLRIGVVGYNLKEDKKLANIVSFLTTHGGAEFSEGLTPNKLDMVVMNPAMLNNTINIPNFMAVKTDPRVRFVKGIDFLENCCKAKTLLPSTSLENLYPGGVLVIFATDILLEVDDSVTKVIQILENEKKKQPDHQFAIKIHRISLQALQNFMTSSEIARKANESVQSYFAGRSSPVLVSRITDEEESKSNNAALPSEILRSVMKLSYLHASKYRYTILLTKDKKLYNMAAPLVQCYDMDGFTKFLQDQEARRSGKPMTPTLPIIHVKIPTLPTHTNGVSPQKSPTSLSPRLQGSANTPIEVKTSESLESMEIEKKTDIQTNSNDSENSVTPMQT